MNCARYERMLFLHRTGELQPEETRALAAHLAVCKRCADIATSLERTNRIAERARLVPPVLADPDALSERIMLAVERESRRSASVLSRTLDRMADLIELPRVRFAAAAFVCTVTLTFLIQQTMLFLSVWELEQRVAEKTAPRPTAMLVYSLERSDVEKLEELRPALEQVFPLREERSTLVISSEALRSYESLLREVVAPRPGSSVGPAIKRETLEHLYETLKESLSMSVMLQTSEG